MTGRQNSRNHRRRPVGRDQRNHRPSTGGRDGGSHGKQQGNHRQSAAGFFGGKRSKTARQHGIDAWMWPDRARWPTVVQPAGASVRWGGNLNWIRSKSPTRLAD